MIQPLYLHHEFTAGDLLAAALVMVCLGQIYVNLRYALRKWQRGGYLRLVRGLAFALLLVISFMDVFNVVSMPMLGYLYIGAFIVCSATSLAIGIVEL